MTTLLICQNSTVQPNRVCVVGCAVKSKPSLYARRGANAAHFEPCFRGWRWPHLFRLYAWHAIVFREIGDAATLQVVFGDERVAGELLRRFLHHAHHGVGDDCGFAPLRSSAHLEVFRGERFDQSAATCASVRLAHMRMSVQMHTCMQIRTHD